MEPGAVVVGATLGPLHKHPTMVPVFRFSAATWNAHLLHFSENFAQSEGIAKPVVQAHLLGAYLVQLVQDWAGPASRLTKISTRSRHPVYVGERVICQGKVIALEGDTVNVELTVATAERECMTGSARIVLPPAAEESDV